MELVQGVSGFSRIGKTCTTSLRACNKSIKARLYSSPQVQPHGLPGSS